MENARRDVIVATTELELVAFKTHSTLIEAAQSMVSANAKKTVAEDRLNACVIRGPYGGRVRQVLINEHELVQRGSTAIEVIDDRVLLAKCLFPSAAFGKIELGQPLQMTILETGNMVEATVSHIAAVLDPASGTFDVFAEIDNADGTLRAGMNASMVLDTSARHPND
jgi:multidrug efflux system membrane fusion protein